VEMVAVERKKMVRGKRCHLRFDACQAPKARCATGRGATRGLTLLLALR